MGWIMKKLRQLYYRWFMRFRRLEIRCVTYQEGDRLIRDSVGKPEDQRWELALPEEDKNKVIGVVYLERRVRITE